MMTLIIQFALIFILFLLSAFFAGTETGVYRLSRLRLRIGVEQKKSSYKLLHSILQDGQGLILSILLGNNLANYLVTSLVTVLLFDKLQDNHTAEIYAAAILTPTLFLFGEIIPKILYYHKANTLMPSLAPLVWLAHRVFTLSGAVAVLKGISKILSLLFRSNIDTAKAVDATQRHQVRQMIHETQEEGLLSEAQKEMMSRLMDIGNISVASVMIKLRDIEMVPVNISNTAMLEQLQHNSHRRQLVYEENKDEIAGFIPLYQVLGASRPFENLREQIVQLLEIDQEISVIEAINILRHQQSTIALVIEKTKQRKKPVGMVTMTDLIEELTGELSSE